MQEVVDDAVKRGRMTRGDAEKMLSDLVKRGRKQTDSLLGELERLVKQARKEVGGRAEPVRPCANRPPRQRAERGKNSVSVEQATGEKPAARGPRRGELLEVEIDSLAFGGRGLARADGFVVFVSGALPGDRVRVEVTKAKKRFAEARTVELLQAGRRPRPRPLRPRRRALPRRPLAGPPLREPARPQEEQVGEALRRIGDLEGFELEEIVPAEQQWRYRNKLEYSFGESEGEELALGFHARGRWDLIVDVDDCQLASEAGNAARNAVRDWAAAGVGPRLRRPLAARASCATSSSARAGAPARSRPAWSPRPRACRGRRSTSTPRSRATPAAPTARPARSARSGCARSSAG